MTGRSEAGVCGVRLYISLGLHATVFQAEIFMVLACAKDGLYT